MKIFLSECGLPVPPRATYLMTPTCKHSSPSILLTYSCRYLYTTCSTVLSCGHLLVFKIKNMACRRIIRHPCEFVTLIDPFISAVSSVANTKQQTSNNSHNATAFRSAEQQMNDETLQTNNNTTTEIKTFTRVAFVSRGGSVKVSFPAVVPRLLRSGGAHAESLPQSQGGNWRSPEFNARCHATR